VTPWLKNGLSALGFALALACASEGLLTHAQPDIATGQPNICYGDTQGVKPGDTATPAECRARLQLRMATYLNAVDRALPNQPNARRGALADFCYNVGIRACTKSSVFRKLKAGDIRGGCNALLLYVYAGGKKYRGLETRRERERELCLQGVK
jgi:lysozyme